MRTLRKFRAIYFAPALAVLALLAWAFASPVGAGPDDDFHLVSTWCAVVDGTSCAEGTEASNRVVPEALIDSVCYAQKPEVSAGCQDDVDFTGSATVLTDRGNFTSAYPPVYYAVMHVFVSSNIEVSAIIMRVVNVVFFVALVTAMFLLLPVHRRPTLIWTWTLTTVPMGLFLLASNNPSGWAITGVGLGWLAILGYLESSGWRKWLLGGIAALATLMAAGSRGDAAIFAILGLGAVFVLTFPRDRAGWRHYAVDAILPVVLAMGSFLLFLSARQTASGIGGFSSGGGAAGQGTDPQALEGFGRLAYNLLNVPFLWAGNFGEWGLGWLDTSMPAVVPYATIACLVAVGFLALAHLWGRKLFVVLSAGLTLWFLPVYVLTAGGDLVGESVQPRYILPLLILLVGLIFVTKKDVQFVVSRAQFVLIIGTLSVANLVALHINIGRYVTGTDNPSLNLDANPEWWWHMGISPMTVWIIGSLAFAATITIVVREVSWPRALPSERKVQAAGQGTPITR